MTVCVSCDTEIAADEVEETAECGHVFHEFCLQPINDNNMSCPGCDPESYAVAQPAPTLSSEPESEAIAEAVPSPVAEGGATPEADLDPQRDAAAVRLRAAIDRAVAAHQAASDAIAALVRSGVTAGIVKSSVEADHQGFAAAVDVCAGTSAWEPYADGMATWPASADVNRDAEEASASYEGNAGLLESAQPLLRAMAVVDLGAGVSDSLSATGDNNVADLALGGASYTGHNLHALTRDLRGWSSIRAEEGFVVIVRWNATKWQVGATGKHVQTSGGDDYKLDAPVATTFVPTLAWRNGSGVLSLS
jgi:hypothetical protein